MKIHLIGEITDVLEGISILSNELGMQLAEDGYPIEVLKRKGPLIIKNSEGQGQIIFEKRIHFFRALGLWLQNFEKKKEFNLIEEPQFETSGAMVDVSRNAVLTVEGIKMLLRKMSVMGLNMLMVYTEETYEVPDLPYFGYMRGRYTEKEIRECDEYAYQIGIEMIPCIQTLAHLKEALKWGYANDIKDTDDILLVGESKTYEFLSKIIESATKPYRSKRIHIGMDEALQLGLGKYIEENGYHNRFEIMNMHLRNVLSITEKFGLQPMIWSDMYFRLASKEGNYYDLDSGIPEDVIQSIPDVQMVYWDYYHPDENFYEKMLHSHKQLVSDPIFAGGLWTWNGISPNYGRMFVTTESALKACRKAGIKEVIATMWGDNGAETPIQTALPGLQLYAEYTYHKEVNRKDLEERFHFCTGYRLDDFLLLNAFDETPGVMKDNLYSSNPSKFLLWQDILIGLYDKNIHGLPMEEHYNSLIKPLELAKENEHDMKYLFTFYEGLARVLSTKAEIGIKIKAAYDKEDKSEVKQYLVLLDSLVEQVEKLRKSHRNLWFSTNKAFGWEVLDIRYGGVLTRIETAIHRLSDWLDGNIPKIEELEENRLYFDGPEQFPDKVTLGREFYNRIVTASNF
ncbi:beta-N-acetylhexosaminidase [Fredinandcohnia quinoae]|uniref:Beta-N-acetylhexosaminidase n=1 Tax=Fredinandcohnia quinoae TaxID=2918902 RepID=A0AAW5E3D1_9BACI|nr:beta-N-acetylhexosaminidase [Fredinandcohnia sp. SECRCQ15]MCH1624501.1 beta-N-acetylhexosaminidase [Fredinandcohnia sp. SECRCQ15]